MRRIHVPIDGEYRVGTGAALNHGIENLELRIENWGSVFVDVWKDLGVDARLLTDELEGFAQIVDA